MSQHTTRKHSFNPIIQGFYTRLDAALKLPYSKEEGIMLYNLFEKFVTDFSSNDFNLRLFALLSEMPGEGESYNLVNNTLVAKQEDEAYRIEQAQMGHLYPLMDSFIDILKTRKAETALSAVTSGFSSSATPADPRPHKQHERSFQPHTAAAEHPVAPLLSYEDRMRHWFSAMYPALSYNGEIGEHANEFFRKEFELYMCEAFANHINAVPVLYQAKVRKALAGTTIQMSYRTDLQGKLGVSVVFPQDPADASEQIKTPLNVDEKDPAVLWAEIHKLRAETQGPDGFSTWREAAEALKSRLTVSEQELLKYKHREQEATDKAPLNRDNFVKAFGNELLQIKMSGPNRKAVLAMLEAHMFTDENGNITFKS